MTIIMPADYYAARKLIAQAAKRKGPVYLRFTRDPIPYIYNEDSEFEIGKAVELKTGEDITIIGNGDTISICLKAQEELMKYGISAGVLDMHTIKPIDKESVEKALWDTGKIITVEDHNIINGLGSAVCEIAAETGKGKVKRIGVQDCFGESAPYNELLKINGITSENIVKTAFKLINHP